MNINSLKNRAKELKKNIYVLYRAFRHPKTPWYAKVLIISVISYALSPIDLIPDFIPVLGYLDDLLLIPAGITLSIRLIPPDVLEECRKQQDEAAYIKSKGVFGAVFIVMIWLLAVYFILKLLRLV